MPIKKIIFVLLLTLISYSFCQIANLSNKYLNSQLTHASEKYSRVVKILNETLTNHNEFKHHAWESTAYIVDTFGPRLLGSENLELALEYMRDLLNLEGFENVNLEKLEFHEKWVRGEERMTLLSPRPYPSKIPMIGLGRSIGGNVTSELVMITSFEELEEKGKRNELENKIVFYNVKWTNYGETVKYRSQGPSLAAKYGAIGCIIRSIAAKSIENPHTGTTSYDDRYKRIPAAAVSLETADMFARMIKRGQSVIVNLYMEARFEKGVFATHNVMGQITGSTKKDEIILIGGHIDSWDVGPQTGANDDAAGFMVCFEAVRMLIKLGLRPERTIRFIAWTGEEAGDGETNGARAYVKLHKDELENHIVAFESDLGTTDLYGFGFSGGAKGLNLINLIANNFLVESGANTIRPDDGESEDTKLLYREHKIPIMRNLIRDTPDSEYYFTYHHSAGDSMNILNPDHMDRNVAGIASMFYLIAEVPWRLPKN